MSKVNEGAKNPLKVVAKNPVGRVLLPLPDAAVANTQPANVVSKVDLATGNFDFTAGSVDGDDVLTATVSGVKSPGFTETVVPDNTVATVEIQPQ